jgi:hypothetical protein
MKRVSNYTKKKNEIAQDILNEHNTKYGRGNENSGPHKAMCLSR